MRGLSASLLTAVAVTVATVPAPCASAAPSGCFDTGGSTICQAPGNVQIDAKPHPLPKVFPRNDGPKWSGLGYDAKFPALGDDPKWANFGYNPKWNGFQPPDRCVRPGCLDAHR